MSSSGTFGEIHGGYHFTLTIGDYASRTIGSLVFAARFDGFVANDDMTRVSHTYLSPTTGQLHLGANLYTVNLLPFQAISRFPDPFSPSGFRERNDPHIDGDFTVSPFVSGTPEPSTICLALLGLATACGSGVYRRLRRTSAKPQAGS